MDNSFHTSFIPKKPVVGTPYKRREPLGILAFISFVIILFTIGAIAGLYFYKDYLNKQLVSKKNSFDIARENLEEKTLVELQTFDRRLNSSQKIISNHIVISPFFYLLNSLTLPNVQFTNFSGSMSDTGKGFAVSMGGFAKDYKTVAVQSEIFNGDLAKELKDVLFTNLSFSDEKNTKGFVSFNLSFFVNPSFISYENNILQYKDTISPVINKENIILDTIPITSPANILDASSSQSKTFNKLPKSVGTQ